MKFMNRFILVPTFVPRKAFKYAQSINSGLETPLTFGDKWTFFERRVPKVFGATSTSLGTLFGKGASDTAVTSTCDDSVCFIISCIGYILMLYNF